MLFRVRAWYYSLQHKSPLQPSVVCRAAWGDCAARRARWGV